MEKGNIQFIYEDGKAPLLEVELVNNNLWLTVNEMARLLNCFVQKINASLRSIFTEHLLWEQDCTHEYRYMDKNIEKQTVYYNLEVLIFLSYRINTMETKVLRQFINSSLREYLQKNKTPKQSVKLVWTCMQAQNYRLN